MAGHSVLLIGRPACVAANQALSSSRSIRSAAQAVRMGKVTLTRKLSLTNERRGLNSVRSGNGTLGISPDDETPSLYKGRL
jgi:hypothetical protein